MQRDQLGWAAVPGGLQDCPASSPRGAELIFNHGKTPTQCRDAKPPSDGEHPAALSKFSCCN